MPQYTVIAVYDDTGDVFCDLVEAEEPHAAMRAAAKAASENHTASEFQIIGAIEGDHHITNPSEDAGRSAYASDLVDDDDESNVGQGEDDGA